MTPIKREQRQQRQQRQRQQRQRQQRQRQQRQQRQQQQRQQRQRNRRVAAEGGADGWMRWDTNQRVTWLPRRYPLGGGFDGPAG